MNRYGLAAAVTAGLAIGGGYLVTSAQYVPPNSSGNGRIVAQLSLTGEQLYTTTGTSSDIALSSSASVFRYTGAGAATFTGFAGGTTGRTVVGRNESSSNVTLPHNVASTAANRLSLPTSVDWTCLPGGSWTQMYVAGSTNRWSVFPGSACFSSTHPMLASAAAAGESPQWDGVQWQSRSTPNDYRSKHLEWSDEWTINVCGANNACGGSLFSISASGTGSNPAAVGTTTRPGIFALHMGSTTTGRCGMATGVNTIDFGSYSTTTFEAIIGFPVLSTVGDEYGALFGYLDVASSLDIVDGCYFLYDRAGSATDPATGDSGASALTGDKWQIWCASNSARTGYLLDGTASEDSFTTVSSPVAALTLPDTNIYHLKIVMDGATKAHFWINGVEVGRITTNIPSGSARGTGVLMNSIKSAGTTDTLVDIDYSHLSIDLTAARTP